MKFLVTGVNCQLGHDAMNELYKRGHEGVGSDIAEAYAGVADGSPVTTMPYVSLDITDNGKWIKEIMKKVWNILKIFTASLIAVFILSMVSMLYKHTSSHVSPIAKETYYRWEDGSFTSTMEEGFAWINMDENGYHNLQYLDSVDILLMGSSHMEAIQISTEDTVASKLNEFLSYSTYNIGISGHSFIHCVNNLKSAIEVFNPQKCIVIETATVSPNIDEMREMINGKLSPVGGPDSGIKRLIQYIPAAKPILNQVLEWGNSSSKNSVGGYSETEDLETISIQERQQVFYSFLNIICDDVKGTGITPIIMYHPSETLSEDGSVQYKTNADDLKMFAKTCEDLGIIFVDMTPDFERMYEEEHILAHGFINTAVGTGHLNKYGHKAIAERLAEVIGGEK